MTIDVIELPQEEKVQRFYEVLKAYSTDKKDPISEWEYLTNEVQETNDKIFCICTTRIRNVHLIQNTLSGLILKIGSECAKKWEFAPECEVCKKPLGGLVRRRKEDDWICRSCKTAKAKEAVLNNKVRKEYLQKNGNQVFFGFFSRTNLGPFYGRRFYEVAPIKTLQTAILRTEIDDDDYRAFREYLDVYLKLNTGRNE
jgi:ribosomal protein L37AE/L43A